MNLAAGIRELGASKGISEELVFDTLKEVLIKAYIKFEKAQEIFIEQDEETNNILIYIQKEVVKKVSDPTLEITLKEAKKLYPEIEISLTDKINIPSEPIKLFNEREIAWVSENIINRINIIAKDIVKHEFMKKINKVVSGYIIKIDHRGIYVDLEKTIGFIPAQEISPLEHYEQDDMIKAMVVDVIGGGQIPNRNFRRRDDLSPKMVQVFLSRNHPDMVKELLAMEVPELADGSIEVKNISRDPGYKTKLAVYSDLVDPVSACIGPHGVRITNVVKELGGEKIDVVRYSEEPRDYIRSALTPAKVDRVIIQDEENNMAFAVVESDQLAYAYGKQKKNVILAARLTGWRINVKTENEVEEEQIESSDVKELKNIFMDDIDEYEETPLNELPGLDLSIIALLEENNIDTVEKLWEVDENDKYHLLKGLGTEQAEIIKKIIAESVEIEEEDESVLDTPEGGEYEGDEENIYGEEEIACPHCEVIFKLAQVDLNNPACPSCQVTLEIEIEDED